MIMMLMMKVKGSLFNYRSSRGANKERGIYESRAHSKTSHVKVIKCSFLGPKFHIAYKQL